LPLREPQGDTSNPTEQQVECIQPLRDKSPLTTIHKI